MSKNNKSHAHKSAPAKKKTPQPSKAPAAKKGGGKTLWILGAVVLIIIGIAAVASGGNGGGAKASGAIPADEAKYIGRYLPQGYEEPNVGGGIFSGAKEMTPITAATTDAGLEFAVNDVSANKIVSFEYAKSDAEKIPMIAYVKPSGRLFVGVSYCVPCKGTGQDIGSDGTLTCRSCGTKRDLESGVGVSGPCKLYPLDELPVKLQGDKIVVDKPAVDNWTVQPLDRQVGG